MIDEMNQLKTIVFQMENKMMILNQDLKSTIGNSVSEIVEVVVKTIDNSKASVKPSESEKKINLYIKCDHCEFKYDSNNLMLDHISEKHTIIPDKCLVVEEVEEVLNRGSEENSVNLKSSNACKCDQCEFKFKKKNNLQKHINAKHLKSEKCEQCQSCFVSKKELKNNTKEKHSKQKGSKQNNAEGIEAGDNEYDSDLENFEMQPK